MSSRVHCPLPARTHTSHAASILRPLSQAEQETSLFSPKPKAQYTLAERKQYWLSQDDLKRRPKQGRGEGEGGLAGRVPRIKVRGTEMGMEEGGLQAVVALTEFHSLTALIQDISLLSPNLAVAPAASSTAQTEADRAKAKQLSLLRARAMASRGARLVPAPPAKRGRFMD